MKIAVGDKRKPLQTDRVKEIISIGHLPRIEQWRVLIDVLPEKKRVLAPVGLKFMGMRRDRQSSLGMNFANRLSDAETWINRFFEINRQQMRRTSSRQA